MTKGQGTRNKKETVEVTTRTRSFSNALLVRPRLGKNVLTASTAADGGPVSGMAKQTGDGPVDVILDVSPSRPRASSLSSSRDSQPLQRRAAPQLSSTSSASFANGWLPVPPPPVAAAPPPRPRAFTPETWEYIVPPSPPPTSSPPPVVSPHKADDVEPEDLDEHAVSLTVYDVVPELGSLLGARAESASTAAYAPVTRVVRPLVVVRFGERS